MAGQAASILEGGLLGGSADRQLGRAPGEQPPAQLLSASERRSAPPSTHARSGLSRLLRLSALQRGGAVGPVDRPAADLADRHLGILITEFTADKLVGHDVGVAVAPTPAGEELVDRGQVTGAAAPSTAAANQPAAGPGAMPTLHARDHVSDSCQARQWRTTATPTSGDAVRSLAHARRPQQMGRTSNRESPRGSRLPRPEQGLSRSP
jgi:hypothetical protein